MDAPQDVSELELFARDAAPGLTPAEKGPAAAEKEAVDQVQVLEGGLDGIREIASQVQVLEGAETREGLLAAEQKIVAQVRVLEGVLDGTRELPVPTAAGPWRPDFTGYHRVVAERLRRARQAAAGRLAGFNEPPPDSKLLATLALDAVFYLLRPRPQTPSRPGPRRGAPPPPPPEKESARGAGGARGD